ncbi:MAG: hypothetical protein PSX71_03370 [bacterium]|nr:hypothetical protein [bacterium]
MCVEIPASAQRFFGRDFFEEKSIFVEARNVGVRRLTPTYGPEHIKITEAGCESPHGASMTMRI